MPRRRIAVSDTNDDGRLIGIFVHIESLSSDNPGDHAPDRLPSVETNGGTLGTELIERDDVKARVEEDVHRMVGGTVR